MRSYNDDHIIVESDWDNKNSPIDFGEWFDDFDEPIKAFVLAVHLELTPIGALEEISETTYNTWTCIGGDYMSYNGWKNYETWNVALWIGNDEGLYSLAHEFHSYGEFKQYMRETSAILGQNNCGSGTYKTPDGVAWNDSGLDIDALDKMIVEL